MKKKYWCSIVCAICIVGTAMTAYAASSASLALQTFQKSAESAAIGLSKKHMQKFGTAQNQQES